MVLLDDGYGRKHRSIPPCNRFRKRCAELIIKPTKENKTMPRYNTVGKHKTCVIVGPENGAVRYHQTQVVCWTSNHMVLHTGGWFTNTTKVRMNQAARQYGLGYRVYQKQHTWRVTYKGGDNPVY